MLTLCKFSFSKILGDRVHYPPLPSATLLLLLLLYRRSMSVAKS